MEAAPAEFVTIDRPGASSGCACGGATDPELPRFAGDLEWLRWQGASVLRIDPRVTGKGLGGHDAALRAVAARGFGALPLALLNGELVHSGNYPSRATLKALLGPTRSQET